MIVAVDPGLNDIMKLLGMETVDWLAKPRRTVTIILIINTLQYMGVSMVIYLAGLQNIPAMYFEAAAIDGCGPFRTFFSIIMPQLKPVTTSVVILTGVTCWNDYQFSLYMLQSPRITSVTLAVSGFFA